MSTIYRSEVIARVPDKWRRQYGTEKWRNNPAKQEIQRKLDEVKIPDKKIYDQIIGNHSWTECLCDFCWEDKEKLIFIPSRAHEEYGDSLICLECLKKYTAEIESS